MLASVIACAPGCSGNPSYFPNLPVVGNVMQPHAGPIGPSYLANFDPHAIDLTLETTKTACLVGSQIVVLATVRDQAGKPRRDRRVDWRVMKGNFVEVDERGYLPGRGGIIDNTAFTFTGRDEERMSRNNSNNGDDIMVRPGQTWCVVSSPDEGDTYVTAIVPAIHNWDKRIKTVVIHWVDASWELPPPASAQAGTEHEFVTRLVRATDRQPLANYKVRYKILDGPPALLMPSRTQEAIVESDQNGLARVRISQFPSQPGVNRVGVEVMRPPDPTAPSASPVVIVAGETSVAWRGSGGIGTPVFPPPPSAGPGDLGPPVFPPPIPPPGDGGLRPPVFPVPAPPPINLGPPRLNVPPPTLGRPMPI